MAFPEQFYRHSIRTRIKTLSAASASTTFNSIVIPLEQGLRLHHEDGHFLRVSHSIVIPLEQGLRLLPLLPSTVAAVLNSIVIPLEQGLRLTTRWQVPHRCLKFYRHSIRTRIKTTTVTISFSLFSLFYRHSIRTRIKTPSRSLRAATPTSDSIVIPLEQGLRLLDVPSA